METVVFDLIKHQWMLSARSAASDSDHVTSSNLINPIKYSVTCSDTNEVNLMDRPGQQHTADII